MDERREGLLSAAGRLDAMQRESYAAGYMAGALAAWAGEIHVPDIDSLQAAAYGAAAEDIAKVGSFAELVAERTER